MAGNDRNRWSTWEKLALVLLNIAAIAAVTSLFFVTGGFAAVMINASCILVLAAIGVDAKYFDLFEKDYRKGSLYALGFLAFVIGAALLTFSGWSLFNPITAPIILPKAFATAGCVLGLMALTCGMSSPFWILDHFAELRQTIQSGKDKIRESIARQWVPVTRNSKHSLNDVPTPKQPASSWSFWSMWQRKTHTSEDTNSEKKQLLQP